MFNFVIVDDNKSQREIISKSIIKSMMSNKLEFNIIEFDDYNNDLIDYIRNDNGDTVYILDIELPHGDGIEIAREIRNKYDNWKSPIIIVTIHTSLLLDAYKQRLQILDFIGKCEDIEKNINENINLCLKMLSKEQIYKYTYKSTVYSININQIDYIQREGRKVKIVTTNNIYYQNISINEIKSKLPSYFILSSKGILINMNNVERIDWSILKVFFKDKISGFFVSKSHRKEIDNYGCN